MAPRRGTKALGTGVRVRRFFPPASDIQKTESGGSIAPNVENAGSSWKWGSHENNYLFGMSPKTRQAMGLKLFFFFFCGARGVPRKFPRLAKLREGPLGCSTIRTGWGTLHRTLAIRRTPPCNSERSPGGLLHLSPTCPLWASAFLVLQMPILCSGFVNTVGMAQDGLEWATPFQSAQSNRRFPPISIWLFVRQRGPILAR